MKANKIVFVITSLGRGGAERVVSILSNYYASTGKDVTIAMLWHNIVGYDLDERIKVLDLSNDKINPKKHAPKLIVNLTDYLLKSKPDAVVSFIAENSIIAGVACAVARVRHITSERVDPYMAHRNRLLQGAINHFYKKCDGVVFQTERAKSFFCEKIQRKSAIIGNPIRVERYADEKREKKIVAVGRLEKQKNHRMLIESFKRISKDHPDYVLEIYGDGKLSGELSAQIEKLELQDKVFLMGNVDNIHQRIASAQIFVLPSDYEGLSNALLEAMMMGIACISTDCAGSDEVIKSGENGILVPVRDTDRLTEALEKLISDDSIREKIAVAGKESTEKFKTENIINCWINIIEG